MDRKSNGKKSEGKEYKRREDSRNASLSDYVWGYDHTHKDRGRSIGKGQSGPGRQRDNKRKMSPKPDSGSKKRRSETQPGPSDDNNSQNVKRQKARKDALNNLGKHFRRYGAGETGTLRRIGQKSTGTPKPVARPTIPRSGAEPVPADDVTDVVDQPLTNLPDPSLRKPKR